MDDTRLGTLLLQGNVVREEDLERCLEIQALTGGSRPLGQILVEQDVIAADDLAELLRLQQERRAAATQPVRMEVKGTGRFMRAAVAVGANELILSEGKPTMIRLGGRLRVLDPEPLEPPELWQFLIDFVGPDALERLAEQQNISTDFHRAGCGRGRVMAFRHFDGACVVVRIHPESVRCPGEAGFTDHILGCVHAGQGLILLTGEVGSGITSTMATILSEVVQQSPQLVVVLDENQEYEMVQGNAVVITRRVGKDVKSYAAGLESAIREQPDVIVIADVSTPLTFDMALRAAEGGRLVIGALHAKSVHGAIKRALNFYPSYDVDRIRNTLAAVLNCVLRLQLIPGANGLCEVMATELLILDNAARAVLRDGSLNRLSLLLNVEHTKSGYSVDTSLERLLSEGAIKLEEAFHYADEKARFLRRAKSKVGVGV